MTTLAPAPAPAPLQGHCSRCGRVWTLAEANGLCQWCGKRAKCQHQKKNSRTIKSRRLKRKQTSTNGKDYDQLPEPYLTFNNVASRFAYKVLADDQQDLLHDIIVALADVANRKPLTEPAMYRIASITVVHYWRAHYKLTSGIDCGSCSKAQRRKCKEHWLYGECPKAIKIEYLSKPILDSEGNLTELGELIADDKALDLDRWIDAKVLCLGLPPRLIAIAGRIEDGETLTHAERTYLCKARKRTQKTLF